MHAAAPNALLTIRAKFDNNIPLACGRCIDYSSNQSIEWNKEGGPYQARIYHAVQHDCYTSVELIRFVEDPWLLEQYVVVVVFA